MTKKTESLPFSAQHILNSIPGGVLVTDADGAIQVTNPTLADITGFDPADLVGQNPRLFHSGRHNRAFFRKMWKALAENGAWKGEVYNRRKNGEIYSEFLTINALRDAAGTTTHYMGIYTDLSREKRAEASIRRLAYFDPLTELPNRSLFKDRLRQALDQAKRRDEILAVLFLDLDRVKIINDTMGHAVGDLVLKGVAQRLRRCLRKCDTVARLGGDEFMILLPSAGHTDDVVRIAKTILKSLRVPFSIDGKELYITASIGISIYPFDGADTESLMKNADTAMNRSKTHGRNDYRIFEPAMKDEVQEQLAVGNGLRRALRRNEFIVHYQPQLDIQSGEIVGMEALVRWQHPELGLLPPSRFIHLAEELGLIVPLGEWVLKKACEEAREWLRNGHSHLKLAVNLSARQFKQASLVEFVAKSLKETGLPAGNLELELTESVLMEHANDTRRIPHELRALGVRFSIDDFGTGYSSLSYLKRLPLNTLKMDQSFVKDLGTSVEDAAIATAVIALGHGLSLSVIAEGVENEHQLSTLRALNCDKMQGFLFSRPVPAEEFTSLLGSRRNLVEETLFSKPTNAPPPPAATQN